MSVHGVKTAVGQANDALNVVVLSVALTLKLYEEEILEGLRSVPASEDIRADIKEALASWRDASEAFLQAVRNVHR